MKTTQTIVAHLKIIPRIIQKITLRITVLKITQRIIPRITALRIIQKIILRTATRIIARIPINNKRQLKTKKDTVEFSTVSFLKNNFYLRR